MKKRQMSHDIPSAAQAKIKIKTCADVYAYWKTKKRHYKRAPQDGIEFNVEYIDTGLMFDERELSEAPIVVALHGAPGSYNDFGLLIRHLFEHKVRIIVPNFPEYIATVKTKVLFRHSADEKAAYLRDFLKAINVSKIDLLVSHSSAVFPTLLILLNGSKQAIEQQQQQCNNQQQPQDINNNNSCNNLQQLEAPQQNTNSINAATNELHAAAKNSNSYIKNTSVIVKFDTPIDIRSLVLLNPAGHRLPMSMKPTWLKCGSVPIYQHKFGRSIYRKLGPGFLTIVGVPVKVDNMDNVMLSATVMRNSKYSRVASQLKQLSEMKLPTLLVFSENDKLIEKEIFYEMTQFMSLDSKQFDVFNDQGEVKLSQSTDDNWMRVMVFEAGGHYAYSNYAKTVNKAISDLLKRVV